MASLCSVNFCLVLFSSSFCLVKVEQCLVLSTILPICQVTNFFYPYSYLHMVMSLTCPFPNLFCLVNYSVTAIWAKSIFISSYAHFSRCLVTVLSISHSSLLCMTQFSSCIFWIANPLFVFSQWLDSRLCQLCSSLLCLVLNFHLCGAGWSVYSPYLLSVHKIVLPFPLFSSCNLCQISYIFHSFTRSPSVWSLHCQLFFPSILCQVSSLT